MPSSTAPIQFEADRFQDATGSYLTDRPDYAPRLIPLVAAACGLDGSGRLLDLGAGPGQLARAFLPYVGSAVMMDPEPGMLALGRSLSQDLPVQFVQGSDRDLPSDLGQFRMVTVGRAFHWMDRAQTLRRLDAMIDPDGAVVLFRIDHLDVPENAWHAGYQAALADVGGARREWQRPGWLRHEAVLLQSAFAGLERIGVVHRVRTRLAAVIGRGLSMSAATRARIGDAEFARLRTAIEAALEPAVRDGCVSEILESVALIARRG